MESTKELNPIALGKAAGEEIRKFRQMFGAVFALGDRLEDIGGLETEVKTVELKLSFLKDREAKLVAGGTLEKAIADLESKLATLKAEEAALRVKVEKGRADAAAVAEELRSVEGTLAARKTELNEVESRFNQIRKKFSA